MTSILQTIHGSRLYGLDNADSDFDLYEVHSGDFKTEHRIMGNMDSTHISLDNFLRQVYSGAHQSIEALFSPVAQMDPMYKDMLLGIRIGGGDAFDKYQRTINAFRKSTEFKQVRHSFRLESALDQLRMYGRVWPRLAPFEVAELNEDTERFMEERNAI